ncbi:MAG: HDIG domain-containing protein [Spirochaetaceae bacterium]|jgi:putative nucleotidyltransferase with HDIG domain|nr:HDIG domain-containing protein [Spirochaetaceae bacterium]
MNIKNKKRKDEADLKSNALERIKSLGIGWKQVVSVFSLFILCMALFLKKSSFGGEFAGKLIVYTIAGVIAVFLCSRRITGRRLDEGEVSALVIIMFLYFIIGYFVSEIRLYNGFFPNSIMLPSVIVVMLFSILIDARLALTMAMVLPLCAFITGCVDVYGYIMAVFSALSGVIVIHGARRRMDLIIAGFVVAAVNAASVASALFIARAPLSVYPPVLFWAAFNGVISGLLILGILPLFENALHMATTFKLIEMLDTDAPLLRRLEQAAPGTYSHSMEVAKLAESACREIGANALLARVGAYYHDIGKIDKADYFVENQNIYNKHNMLNPRLSATVIRSHVKLGIEKARAMGLPNEVIEIIASHHGNSLITWFYHSAVEREGDGNVNKEDFCYPGNPPHTKEAAVVMLADVTEAACRTLDKPTSGRLEKFINDLIDKKIEARQLSDSDLTFNNLEVIKKTFVRVLVAHYHARIEYPNQEKQVKDKDETKST